MKKHQVVLLLMLVASILLISACGGGAPAATQALAPGDAAAGKLTYDKTCVACHGLDGKGKAGLGKNLVTSEFVKSKTDAELVAFITAGRPTSDPANTTGVAMPPKGGNPDLSDKDLADVVAYIRTLQ